MIILIEILIGILMGILMGVLMGILMMNSMEWPYDSSDCFLFLQGVGAIQNSPISCGESMCPLLDSGFAVCSVYC